MWSFMAVKFCAPVAPFKRWSKMLKMRSGAIWLMRVVGPNTTSAFRTPHSFSTVLYRLLDGDLCRFTLSDHHAFIENRLHSALPAREPSNVTLSGSFEQCPQ